MEGRLAGQTIFGSCSGFGLPRREGKMVAIRRARGHKIPYLGVCLGMQMAVTEFCSRCLWYGGAIQQKSGPDTPYPVNDLMPDQRILLTGRHHAPWLLSLAGC